MYRQFCKNLKNYFDINKSHIHSYRYKIAKEIEILSNVDLYNELKYKQNKEYMQISNFIYQMSNRETANSHISKFVWELWAYGFDAENFTQLENDLNNDKYNEKIKLIDLLLGTHYWA